jgi:RimJ/RimL family protein N-acetyltransferase
MKLLGKWRVGLPSLGAVSSFCFSKSNIESSLSLLLSLSLSLRQQRSCQYSIPQSLNSFLSRDSTRTTRLFSVSAYSGIPSDGKGGTEKLPLPLMATLPNRMDLSSNGSTSTYRVVQVDTFQTSEEIETGRRLMNHVIIEGKSWPFETIFETDESYRGYFLSDAAFVVRSVDTDNVDENGAILGCFYIKPNYPGRCSHIANGGFIVDPKFRGSRVGTLMGACFKRFAKDLGYRAAYFNLVFASNEASVNLWEKLGFDRVAIIPRCARLEGMPLDLETGEPMLDTAYGYHINLDALPDDYDPLKETGFYVQS